MYLQFLFIHVYASKGDFLQHIHSSFYSKSENKLLKTNQLKVHKREKFFVSDFEFFTIL